jgi:hypothetical protein
MTHHGPLTSPVCLCFHSHRTRGVMVVNHNGAENGKRSSKLLLYLQCTVKAKHRHSFCNGGNLKRKTTGWLYCAQSVVQLYNTAQLSYSEVYFYIYIYSVAAVVHVM